MKAETRLMAAAALAAGVNSSPTQAIVYSQNVVGYLTQSIPGLYVPAQRSRTQIHLKFSKLKSWNN